MFNLNGHTYYGLDEMDKVWEFYHDNAEIGIVPIWDMRIYVDGDLAYLTSEGILPTRAVTEAGWGASNAEASPDEMTEIRFRETSVLRRDDGEGNAEWKIWHFHCSVNAPIDEVRPGFDDTWASRNNGEPKGVQMMTVERPL
jgi:hypothetical protein